MEPTGHPTMQVGSWHWRHVSGTTVRHVYRTCFARVRVSGEPVVLPFRCDSPRVARFSWMVVRLLPCMDPE